MAPAALVWRTPGPLLHLVLCSVLGTAFANPLRGFGQYTVYVDKLYKCGSGVSNDKFSFDAKVTKFDVRKPNELQVLSGVGNLSTPYTDKHWAIISMDSDSNGRWKPNALVFKLNEAACSGLHTHVPNLYRMLVKNKSGRAECPIPKGVVNIDGPINWTFPKFPVLPFGHFRLHVTSGVDSETHFCHTFETYAIPRKH